MPTVLASPDDFLEWLRKNGTPAEVGTFSASFVQGLVMMARGRPVQQVHIDEAARLALDSGLDQESVANLRRLGALVLRYQETAVPAAPQPSPSRSVRVVVRKPTTTNPQMVPAPTTAGSRPATQKPQDPKPEVARSRLWRAAPMLTAGLALTALAAGLYQWRSRSKARPTSAPPVATATPGLEKLDLPVRLPAGWQHLPGSGQTREAPGGAVKIALLYRGGTPSRPQHAAFVGVLPLSGDIAAGATLSDDALLIASRNGDAGLRLQVFEAYAKYTATECEVLQLAGQRTGVCRGVATRKNTEASLRTYLRVGRDRGILALFMAAPTVVDPSREEAAIVASLQP